MHQSIPAINISPQGRFRKATTTGDWAERMCESLEVAGGGGGGGGCKQLESTVHSNTIYVLVSLYAY